MADPLSSITGVSSGMDWKSLVDQIMTAERRPAVRMQATVDANAARKTALTAFQGTLKKLQSATDGLRFGGAFNQFTVTATGADPSGRAVLSATVGSNAPPGSYTVQVTRLAQAQKTVASVGQASATAVLGAAGALQIGGQTVAVSATDSIAAVRDAINRVQAQTGVQATLVAGRADGSDQRLVLTSTRPGSAAAFTVADDPATPFTPPAGATSPPASLTAFLGLDGPPAVDARDAELTVDGIPVTRSANTVADAIPGVTLSLATTGTSTVAVARQGSAATDAVKGFVDAFNAVREAVRTQTSLGADGKRPPLFDEPLVRSLGGTLSGVLLGSAARTDGQGAATGVAADLTTLGSAGVELLKDGTLSYNAERVQSASDSRLDALKAVLADRTQAIADVVGKLANPYTGAIDTRARALDSNSARLTSRITDVDARLDKRRASLLAQYAKFESSLGRLKAVGDQMSAQFTGLTNSNNNS